MEQPLPAVDTPPSALQVRAALLLKAGIATVREARPDMPTALLLTDGLAASLQATLAEGATWGLGDDLMDEALAATFGFLMVSGPEHLHPMGGDAALRIERFIKRALHAAEATRQALDEARAAEGQP